MRSTRSPRVRRLVAGLGTVMGYLAGWGFILCAAFITFDVLARRFFGFSSQSTTEITGYALAFGISWGLAHTLTARAHVRIDVLINHLPPPSLSDHLLSLAALGVFVGFIAWGAYALVDESLLFGATDISLLRTPLWLPQGLWAFGIAVFLALIVVMLVENALLVVAGRGAEVEAQLHTRTYDEEAGGGPRGGRREDRDRGAMIAVAFLLVLVGLTVGLSLFGGGGSGLPVAELLLLVALFIAFFGAGIYVGAALGVLGLIAGFAFSDRPFWAFLGQTVWNPSSSFVLVAVPLFLLMGEILLRAGLSDRLYKALNVWLDRLPGGLLHTNIAASGVFSAISGSSVATAATMGSVALPFFKGTRYDPKMVLGSLAAGGALGNLVPPGITFIVYALMTETSVGALYIAAVGPCILVMALFVLVILARVGPGGADRPHPAAAAAGREAAQPQRPRPDRDPHPRRARHDLWRARDTRPKSAALGVARRHDLRRDRGQAQLPHAQHLGGSNGAQHGADRAHRLRRLCPELRAGRPRRAAGARQDRRRDAAAALGHHAAHHRLLSRARHLHGRLLDDRHDDPGRVPDQ